MSSGCTQGWMILLNERGKQAGRVLSFALWICNDISGDPSSGRASVHHPNSGQTTRLDHRSYTLTSTTNDAPIHI